jgi:hypothetical protein
LKWLRIHHSDYRDIVIKETNLNWMGDKPEKTMLGHIKHFHSKDKTTPSKEKPAVSQVQCMNPSGEPELNFAMLEHKSSGVDPDQEKYMNELVDATVSSNNTDKLLMFPPHGDTPVRLVSRSNHACITF